MKHLIIEGCDRSGKDSLIRNLMPYCQNLIVTHFSTPEGKTDLEKRQFQEDSFRKEFKKGNFFINSDLFEEPKKGKMNLLVWNRAHLGEFVYGNLYRQTNPEEWVMKLEEDYEYHKFDNVYLLLLTADPKFLASKDDGESFDASSEARSRELENFRAAFNMSQIKKKLEIQVDHDETIEVQLPQKWVDGTHHTANLTRRAYKDADGIAKQVLQFLNS